MGNEERSELSHSTASPQPGGSGVTGEKGGNLPPQEERSPAVNPNLIHLQTLRSIRGSIIDEGADGKQQETNAALKSHLNVIEEHLKQGKSLEDLSQTIIDATSDGDVILAACYAIDSFCTTQAAAALNVILPVYLSLPPEQQQLYSSQISANLSLIQATALPLTILERARDVLTQEKNPDDDEFLNDDKTGVNPHITATRKQFTQATEVVQEMIAGKMREELREAQGRARVAEAKLVELTDDRKEAQGFKAEPEIKEIRIVSDFTIARLRENPNQSAAYSMLDGVTQLMDNYISGKKLQKKQVAMINDLFRASPQMRGAQLQHLFESLANPEDLLQLESYQSFAFLVADDVRQTILSYQVQDTGSEREQKRAFISQIRNNLEQYKTALRELLPVVNEETASVNAPSVAELYQAAKDQLTKVFVVYEDRLVQGKAQVEDAELSHSRPRLAYAKSTEIFGSQMSVDQEKMVTYAIQQFHPTKGEYWSLPPEKAVTRLNDFVFSVKDTSSLPDEIKKMLVYAALAPDRGIVNADRLILMNEYISDISYPVAYPDLAGIHTLMVECPEEFRPIKEARLEHAINDRLQRLGAAGDENVVVSCTNDISAFVRLGMIPPPSANFFRYVCDLRDKILTVPNLDKTIDIADDLLLYSRVRDQNSEDLKIYDIWKEKPSSSSPDQIELGYRLLRQPYLDSDKTKTKLFLGMAEAYMAEDGLQPEQRLKRIGAVIRYTETFLQSSERDQAKIAILRAILLLPTQYDIEIHGSFTLLDRDKFSIYDFNKLFPYDPAKVYKDDEYYTIATDGSGDYRKFNHRAIQKVLKQTEESLKRRTEVSQHLAQGQDTSLIYRKTFEQLRIDPEYQQWEEGVRARLVEILGPIESGAGFTTDPESGYEGELFFDAYGLDRAAIGSLVNRSLKAELTGNRLFEKRCFDIGSFLERIKVTLSKLNRDDYVSAVSAVGGIPVSTLNGIYCQSEKEETRAMYCLPKQKGPYDFHQDNDDRLIMDYLTNLDQPGVQTVVGNLGLWQEQIGLLRQLPFFAQTYNCDLALQQLQVIQNAYQKLSQAQSDPEKKAIHNQMRQSSSAEIRALVDGVMSMRAINNARKVLSSELHIDPQRIAVEGGYCARLANPYHYEFGEKGYDALNAIVPVNIEVSDKEFYVISGPTGSGKTAAAAAFGEGLVAGDYQLPLARAVTVPDRQHLLGRVGMVGFKSERLGRESMFMTAMRQQAVGQSFTILVRDEPGSGAPHHYREALVEASILEHQSRGGTTVLTTHQAAAMTEMFDVLGLKTVNKYVDPLSHRLVDGVSGSYGLPTLREQGCPPAFVQLVQEFLDAQASDITPGSFGPLNKEIPYTPEDGPYISDASLNSLGITAEPVKENVLQYFVARAETGPRELGIMYRLVKEAAAANSHELGAVVGYYENMASSDHKTAIAATKSVYDWLDYYGQHKEHLTTANYQTLTASPTAENVRTLAVFLNMDTRVLTEGEYKPSWQKIVSDFAPEDQRQSLLTLTSEVDGLYEKARDQGLDYTEITGYGKEKIQGIIDKISYHLEYQAGQRWTKRDIEQAKNKLDNGDFSLALGAFSEYVKS